MREEQAARSKAKWLAYLKRRDKLSRERETYLGKLQKQQKDVAQNTNDLNDALKRIGERLKVE